MAQLAVRVAAGVREALQPPRLSLVHLHVHVLPRRDDDNLLLNWPRTGIGDPDSIAETAARIRERLSAK